MLRERNKLMHSGHTEKANALSLKIEKAITVHNSKRLTDVNLVGGCPAMDSSNMWRLVNEVTGKGLRLRTPTIPNLSASDINNHYANVSTDSNYQ